MFELVFDCVRRCVRKPILRFASNSLIPHRPRISVRSQTAEFRVCSRCLCRCVRELCSTEHVFEVCSCVRTCVRRVRVDSLVKGTCVRAFDGTRSRNTEILCSSVFCVREQLRYIYILTRISGRALHALNSSRSED